MEADGGAGGPEARSEPPAVEVERVGKTYDRGGRIDALADVSFVLPRGSFTAVMGPSGSGKSTLLNLVGCLDAPTTGSIRIRGREVTGLSGADRTAVRREEIGFVFQTFNLMPRLTARENVALPLLFQGISRGERRERARDRLAAVGLDERLDHRPTELSGGQRQRVAIARALVTEPTLVLADEPTGNVDTGTGTRIMAAFERVHDAGNTLLVVTHERRIAEHADRIVHLGDGRIERVEGTADAGGPSCA